MHKFSAYISLSKITSAFFPSQCLLCACSLKSDLLCAQCLHDLPHNYGQLLCVQCGLRNESLSDFCGHCLRHPPAFSRSFIPFSYQYPLDHLIHKFKYYRHLTSGKLLGHMLADYLKYQSEEHSQWVRPDLIIPVPMHWMRRWQRGFNQADVLAHYLAQALDIPLATHLLKRIHKTPAQKELSRNERQKNLRNAFSIPVKLRAHLQGKNIALVDDVVTTTATVREISQLLTKAGAKDVQVWALARTM